jgi:Phage tail assembly chaperone protein
MADRKLTHPDGGQPIDTADKPVTTDPVEGGVAIVNASVPAEHDAHVVYREQTADEKKDRRETSKTQAAFTRADASVFVRLTRDELLRRTDWMDHRAPYADDKTWQKWRQQLRDLPAKTKNPESPSWPKPPEAVSALLEHRRLWPTLDWSSLT